MRFASAMAGLAMALAAALAAAEVPKPTVTGPIAATAVPAALGGIRLSQIEVPTARNVGQSASGGACPRWGYHLPFDVATLDSLYRSHGDYLNEVVGVTKHNLKSGYILKPDAVRTIEQAEATDVGRGPKQHFDFDRDRDFDRDD